MKLLFDQNISYRVVSRLKIYFPDSKQVREIALENSSDIKIWQYARTNHFTIVTFDADFFDLSNIKGHPPKIIWLRTGNYKTDDLAKLLLKKNNLILEFLTSEKYADIACLEIVE
ncbi:MAG: DUF5615 family PIN-like protein [Bacteroidetes bacterium]|nr:DUF5615 family PIN-like protein [Bacteroidota bacterium]